MYMERRPSVVDTSRTLYPLSFPESATPSPSTSRRGSLIDPFRPSLLSSINSPPSSPSSRSATPPPFWRRESLPSISYLTHIHDQRRHSIATTKLKQEQEVGPKRRDSTPYSRSPELRVSHKLAERKRRKEMKDLFDDLRDLLPLDKGLKTSKWEILSKTLEYIRILQQKQGLMEREKADLVNEINALRSQT